MCRGFQQNEDDRILDIKAFYIRLSLSSSKSKQPSYTTLPGSLTLYYLPRINGGPLEINSSKIRPDSPAFLTLHRLVSETKGFVCFGSRERVKASQGARFEVYSRDDKVLKGIFRKDCKDEWKMECACGLESGDRTQEVVKEAQVCVMAEGDAAMTEKVEMVVKRKRRCFRGTLEEIPEEGECEVDDCCCYSCSETEEEMEVGSSSSSSSEDVSEEETEVEGMSWAVDVGIWVMFLGVGFLVSKASSKRLLRRTRIL